MSNKHKHSDKRRMFDLIKLMFSDYVAASSTLERKA